jgi:hypothetical protein
MSSFLFSDRSDHDGSLSHVFSKKAGLLSLTKESPPEYVRGRKGGRFYMSGYYYGFGLRRLLLFLLVIATIFALVGIWY